MPQIKDIAITKTVAADTDFLIMQNPITGETYKITKASLLAGVSSAGGGSTPTDIALLMHFEGINGSTNIIDSSPNHRIITVNGNTKISTSQSRYGSSSIRFNGDQDYLNVPYSTDFAFGLGDFTIELSVYFNSFPNVVGESVSPLGLISTYLGNGGYASWDFFYDKGANTFTFGRFVNGTNNYKTFPFSAATNTWYDVVFCRKDGVAKMLINNLQIGSDANFNTDLTLVGNDSLIIGRRRGGNSGEYIWYLDAYIDEYQITNRAKF